MANYSIPDSLKEVLSQSDTEYAISFDNLIDEILNTSGDIKEQLKDTGLDDDTLEYVVETYVTAFREGYKACAMLFKEALTESEEKNG